MEPIALVDVIHGLCDEFKIVLQFAVTDDDSKMKADARWNNGNHCKHNGDYPWICSSDGKT